MISYRPLMVTLANKNMKKTDLLHLAKISTVTLAKFSKNQPVSLKAIERICITLACRIEDVVEIAEYNK